MQYTFDDFTIIITTYNSSETIIRLLSSIMKQGYIGNIIIGDDKSVDNTIDLIKKWVDSYKYKFDIYVNNKNLGSSNNRVKNASRCSTTFFTFVDSDDLINIETLHCLFTRVDPSKINTSWITKITNTNISSLNFKSRNTKEYLEKSLWSICGIIFTHEQFSKVNFLKTCDLAEDINVLGLISEHCINYLKAKDPLYYYITNNSSLSRSITSDNGELSDSYFEQILNNRNNLLRNTQHSLLYDVIYSKVYIWTYFSKFEKVKHINNSLPVQNENKLKIFSKVKRISFLISKSKVFALLCIFDRDLYNLFLNRKIKDSILNHLEAHTKKRILKFISEQK